MKEFIILMAFLMAMVALSIDGMLPALAVMGADLRVERANDMQFVISFIFTGMTIGQMVYGPLADAMGRKRALYIGLCMFMAGSLLSFMATSLPVMLLGRFIQGLGVASPRIVTTAIVRDRHHGRDMAYIMSMVMGVFIMVPTIAPAIGELIMHFSSWRAIFLFYIVASGVAMVWTYFRLEETLTPEHYRAFNLRMIWSGFKEAATTRVMLGYTICGGFAFAAMLGYLTSSQQIFQGLYLAGDRFALYFGMLAVCIGVAFFSNSLFVRRLGMRRITRASIHLMIINAALFLPFALIILPPLPLFMLYMGVNFFCLGLMFGNLASMAMEPMGHMAGLASAFNGAVSSAMGLLLGTIIGQALNGTLVPLAVGFLVFSVVAMLTMRWVEKGHPSSGLFGKLML